MRACALDRGPCLCSMAMYDTVGLVLIVKPIFQIIQIQTKMGAISLLPHCLTPICGCELTFMISHQSCPACVSVFFPLCIRDLILH